MNTSTFVTSIVGVVLGIFGMNFEEPLFKAPHAFVWTLTTTIVCGLVIFCLICVRSTSRREGFSPSRRICNLSVFLRLVVVVGLNRSRISRSHAVLLDGGRGGEQRRFHGD